MFTAVLQIVFNFRGQLKSVNRRERSELLSFIRHFYLPLATGAIFWPVNSLNFHSNFEWVLLATALTSALVRHGHLTFSNENSPIKLQAACVRNKDTFRHELNAQHNVLTFDTNRVLKRSSNCRCKNDSAKILCEIKWYVMIHVVNYTRAE